MKEILLFMSICWPSSRTRISYFEKRGVNFERRSSLCRLIWAGILAICANMSK